MWLSEKAAARAASGAGTAASAKVGSVTIGGKSAAVLLTGECRNLGVLSPQGVTWRPSAGTQVLVLETDDGERFIAGALDGGGSFGTLGDGEVCLRGGDAWLKLGADGVISAEGNVHLDGDVYITGRLFLNGVQIAVMAGTED